MAVRLSTKIESFSIHFSNEKLQTFYIENKNIVRINEKT